jgi:hypothetical protein
MIRNTRPHKKYVCMYVCMYLRLHFYFKYLYAITLMMIVMLQNRNTYVYFAYIGVPYIPYRNTSNADCIIILVLTTIKIMSQNV